jgi:hypothetical protein
VVVVCTPRNASVRVVTSCAMGFVCLLIISGMVDTIDSGIVPEVPSKAGLTLPASGSRGKQVNTSAYI